MQEQKRWEALEKNKSLSPYEISAKKALEQEIACISRQMEVERIIAMVHISMYWNFFMSVVIWTDEIRLQL